MLGFSRNKAGKRVALVDLDGTLVVVRHLAHLVVGPKRDLNAYHTLVENAPLNRGVLQEVERVRREGAEIFVLTSRPETHRSMTNRWLRFHRVPVNKLIMRGNGDKRGSDVYKRDVVRKLKRQGYTVVKAWDDEPDVVSMYRDEGVDVTKIPGWIGR